uniref:Uncharacterized protein n=1 Tax=Acrobeloides nanus TaxID=290746 RepID=A0A914EGE1_9BILA
MENDDENCCKMSKRIVEPKVKLDWHSDSEDEENRKTTSSYINEPEHKRKMLELIQKEMDEARRRVEVDEFGDFSRSRYGRKPPTNEFLVQREPKLFTVDEKTLGRDEIRATRMQYTMSTQNLVNPSAQKIEWAARKFGISAWPKPLQTKNGSSFSPRSSQMFAASTYGLPKTINYHHGFSQSQKQRMSSKFKL